MPASEIGNGLFEAFIPPCVLGRFRKAPPVQSDEVAMNTFRSRLSVLQSNVAGQPYQRAAGFDYVRWKPHGQHRMHNNPDEYVQTCQGLAPYVSSVAVSSWEGLEERRWAGLTQAPPEVQQMPPRSGYTSAGAGSRSNLGSREFLSK